MREKLFKVINTLGITALLRLYKKNNLTVLSLHRISEEEDYFFQPIKPHLFESLLKYIQKHYNVISFSDLSNINSTNTKPPLILSFDDGYYDFLEYAMPILSKHKMPSNHNLVNECLNRNSIIWTQQLNDCFTYFKQKSILEDKDLKSFGLQFGSSTNTWEAYYLSVFHFLLNQKFSFKTEILNNIKSRYGIISNYRMMTWDDARQVMSYNVEIGSHSYNHDSLNTLTLESEMINEIGKSKRELEEKLNTPINIIAFPNGKYNDQVMSYCEKIGFGYLLLVNDAVSPLSYLNQKTCVINRIGLGNESINEMVSRVELLHPRLRKIL